MEETILKEEKKEHVPYAVGRQYVMDWRTSQQNTEDNTEKAPLIAEAVEEKEHSPVIADSGYHSQRRGSGDMRLLFCIAAGIAGMALGALVAVLFPDGNADLSGSLTVSSEGGFLMILFRRIIQCGAFLLAEFVIGYFAAGGWIVWLAPLIYGLGAGLSAAAVFIVGQAQWMCVFCVLYTAVICFAAKGSWEFSALLMRLISGRGEMYASGGSSSAQYTLRFGGYLILLLALALAEAGIKSAVLQ